MLCMVFSTSGQERKILNISDSVSVIRQTAYTGQNFEGLLSGLKSINRLQDIYKINIFNLYDIRGCDTELKQKNYKNSSEGKHLMEELNERKQKIVNSKLYYIFPFNANNGWTKEYNLKSKTFDFEYIIDDDEYVPIPGYLNFKQLVIKCNPAIKQYKVKKYNSNTRRYFYQNMIKIPMTEKLATSIERDIHKLAIAIDFKVQKFSSKTKQASMFSWDTYSAQGIASKIYIIDTETNEIYFSL